MEHWICITCASLSKLSSGLFNIKPFSPGGKTHFHRPCLANQIRAIAWILVISWTYTTFPSTSGRLAPKSALLRKHRCLTNGLRANCFAEVRRHKNPGNAKNSKPRVRWAPHWKRFRVKMPRIRFCVGGKQSAKSFFHLHTTYTCKGSTLKKKSLRLLTFLTGS